MFKNPEFDGAVEGQPSYVTGQAAPGQAEYLGGLWQLVGIPAPPST